MYTEGEWKVIDDHAFIDIMAGKGKMIASIRRNNANSQSNAHLIAAAPDMYEALLNITGVAEGFDTYNSYEAVDLALKAIRKAEGK